VFEQPAAVGRYLFAHPLIRETLYESPPRDERVRLHRRIGEALAALHNGDPGEHAAELAHHFYIAAAAGETEKAITYAEIAANRAFGVAAYEEAARLYDSAIQVLETSLPVDRGRRASLRLILAKSLWRAGRTGEARDIHRAALDDARTVSDPALFARAVTSFASGHAAATVVDESLLTLIEDALGGLGDSEPALRCSLLSEMAKRLQGSPSLERGDAVGREAIDIAREIGDDRLLGLALWAWHDATSGPDNLDERLAALDELVRCSGRVGDEHYVHAGRVRLLAAHLENGDLLSFDLELTRLGGLGERLRFPNQRRWLLVARAARALLTGSFADAEPLMLEALALGQQIADPDALAIFGGQLLQLRWDQGRIEEVEAPIREGLRANPSFIPFRASLAHIYAELDRIDEARAELSTIAAPGFSAFPRNRVWVVTLLMLAQACASLDDKPRARELYDLLLPFADRCGVVSQGHLCTGSNQRALGVLASTLGRFDDAEQHFEQALAANERMSARPYLTRTQVDYARMLLKRGQPDDDERAAGLLAQALPTATELGMVRLAEEAEGLAAISYAGPDGTVTLLFTDIEDSVKMTEQLGDRRWMEVLRRHNDVIRDLVATNAGYEVKSQGDGFMLVFSSAGRALECAIAIQRAAAAADWGTDGHPVRLRMGLHAGEVIKESRDFFGHHVNLASRIASSAQGGEILVSALLKGLIDSSGAFEFSDGRELELKGLEGSHTVFGVRW
jgi:class 3 adenylate cyclase